MSGGLALMVDERMLIQGSIFLCALFIINYFYVSPLVKLYKERNRRTQGSVSEAELLIKSANELEMKYNLEINKSVEEARNLRNSNVSEGAHIGKEVIAKAQSAATQKISEATNELEKSIQDQSLKIESLSQEITKTILNRLNVTPIIISFFIITKSYGAGTTLDLAYSVFWPFFQFAVFLTAGWFLGRNALTNKLQQRRDLLRLKISEAQEALETAKAKAQLYEFKLNDLDKEKANIINGYLEDGQKEKAKIIQDAQETANLILKNAERQIEEAAKKSRQQLADSLLEKAFISVEENLKKIDLTIYNNNLLNEMIDKSEALNGLI